MNPRISTLSNAEASPAAVAILDQTQAALGVVPNLHRTLAHAPAALKAYTSMAKLLAGGSLEPQLRESIALAIAAKNGCGYCASAHRAIGKGLGMVDSELARNLDGISSDSKNNAALRLATELLRTGGDISDSELAAARSAGFSDESIVEITAHVALNAFTNMFNHLAQTEIDFPPVDVAQAK